MRKHEKKVYDALYLYFDTVLRESGHINTTLEMGKNGNRWVFEQENMSGAFMFVFDDVEVYATPYWENAEGLAYAIYQNGELLVEGTLPLVVTGNSPTDTDAYVGIINDLIGFHNL